jgi:hypothetical protein
LGDCHPDASDLSDAASPSAAGPHRSIDHRAAAGRLSFRAKTLGPGGGLLIEMKTHAYQAIHWIEEYCVTPDTPDSLFFAAARLLLPRRVSASRARAKTIKLAKNPNMLRISGKPQPGCRRPLRPDYVLHHRRGPIVNRRSNFAGRMTPIPRFRYSSARPATARRTTTTVGWEVKSRATYG